ncbi:MAG: hypothetical protein QGD89_09755 [Actinomycetota bacterium]|nr:hypothetical protein [Actinomycetota bacterium]
MATCSRGRLDFETVGLDRQADGGTHVSNTVQVDQITIAKVVNKGRGFRRIRIRLEQES